MTAILSPEGTLTKEYTYDSFGKASAGGSSTFSNEVQFTGAISDGGGIYYMNSRYYSANTGRFLTQDSYKGNAYEPWTQHLYAYCGNNPVNMVDPTGHMPRTLVDMGDGTGSYIKSATYSYWIDNIMFIKFNVGIDNSISSLNLYGHSAEEMIGKGLSQIDGSFTYNGKECKLKTIINYLDTNEISTTQYGSDIFGNNCIHYRSTDFLGDFLGTGSSWTPTNGSSSSLNSGAAIFIDQGDNIGEDVLVDIITHESVHQVGVDYFYIGATNSKGVLPVTATRKGASSLDMMWGGYRMPNAYVTELDRILVATAQDTNQRQKGPMRCKGPTLG